MDGFEASSKILSLAIDGTSHTKISVLYPHLNQGEIKWLLKLLVDRNLLEADSSTYWTTVDGVKFLEIQFHMERMLQVQKSLV